MDINLMYQLDYLGVSSCEEQSDSGKTGCPVLQPDKTPIASEKFSEDIKILREYSGITDLAEGISINITLQDILKIMPRKRPRIDSYNSLIKYLRDELGAELIITSNKSKNNDN